MTTIQRETYWDAQPGIKGLIEDHWREVALYRDKVVLDPDWSRYVTMENQNRLVVITARQGSEMVGYSVFFLGHHVHYKGCLVASNDVIYVKPENRGVVGVRLIQGSERILADLGVNRVTWHVKPRNDWSGALERMGYDREEVIMGKLLEK